MRPDVVICEEGQRGFTGAIMKKFVRVVGASLISGKFDVAASCLKVVLNQCFGKTPQNCTLVCLVQNWTGLR